MRSLNILVAEDDEQNQAMMKLILIRQGHQVRSAWNGQVAVEAAKSENFDLIFMDVQMPEMDGIEATRQIRTWENSKKHTPIVMVTGSVPGHVTDELKQAGADTFISKPFDVRRIRALIEIIASDDDRNSTQIETGSNSNLDKGDLQLLDTRNGCSRFENNSQFYLENLVEFSKTLPDRLAKLQNALLSADWENLSLLSHNLKGVAANFGAAQLANLAAGMEQICKHKNVSLANHSLIEINQNVDRLIEKVNTLNDQDLVQQSDLLGRQ